MPAPEMSVPVFAILNGLIAQRCGVHHRQDDRELLADKITGPMLDAGFETFLDYYYFLRYDEGGTAALDTLIESLLVHETYFFRELRPLTVAIDHVIAPLVHKGLRPRIWCAACSTGEEAITIAMLLAERGFLAQCEVIASDLSKRALARARAGRHGRRALRGPIPAAHVGRFREHEDGIESDLSLREAIEWRQINIVDAAAVARIGPCDLIVCRNVLIYFDDEVTVKVLDVLGDALAPEGSLLVGVSESLLRFGTRLRCEEHGSVFMYTKADSDV